MINRTHQGPAPAEPWPATSPAVLTGAVPARPRPTAVPDGPGPGRWDADSPDTAPTTRPSQTAWPRATTGAAS
jgi:hypothetical protein